MLGIQFEKKDVTDTLNVRSHTAPREQRPDPNLELAVRGRRIWKTELVKSL